MSTLKPGETSVSLTPTLSATAATDKSSTVGRLVSSEKPATEAASKAQAASIATKLPSKKTELKLAEADWLVSIVASDAEMPASLSEMRSSDKSSAGASELSDMTKPGQDKDVLLKILTAIRRRFERTDENLIVGRVIAKTAEYDRNQAREMKEGVGKAVLCIWN
jgi:hypothetical protein